MTLETTSQIAGVFSGLVLPVMGILVWQARGWIKREVISCLRNDDTPVAKYAHDARDAANDAKDAARDARSLAGQALDATNQGNQLLAAHVMNADMHRVH